MPPSNQDQSTSPAASQTDAATQPAHKEKTAVGKILAGIGHVVAAPFTWGVKEFGNIAKLFHAEEPQLQADLTAVSGVLQLIKLNINEAPAVVLFLVKKAYPQFDEATLTAYLKQGITDLDIAEKVLKDKGDTFADLLEGIAQHVLSTTDTGWKLFWDGLYKSIAVVAVPGTLWEKIVSYAAYIYNVLVKPNVK